MEPLAAEGTEGTAQAPAPAPPAGGPPPGAWISAFLPFVLLFAIFWFALIRPQQREQKKRREMLSKLKRGDKVVTVGGIYGEIVAIKDDEVRLQIADKVEITIARSGIGQLRGKS